MTEAEAEKAPAGMPSLPMTGLSDHRFAITTSVMDCTGCTLCVGICPGKRAKRRWPWPGWRAKSPVRSTSITAAS